MKDAIMGVLKSLWDNHKKTMLGFLLGLIFSGLALLTGVPVGDIKQIAHDVTTPAATSPAAPAPAPAPAEKPK